MAEVYKVGVSLVLQNGVSSVLAVITRDLLGLRAPISAITKGFEGWKPAILLATGALAGGEMLRGLVSIAKAGGDVNHQLELMKAAGMSVGEINDANAKAMQTSTSVITTTYAENLKHLRELRYAFGNPDVAMGNLDQISRANAVLNTVKGGGKDEVWELVKSLEGKGLTYNPAEFSSYVDTMTKVIEATGGRVTPQMFMSTFKYGRTATLGWDEAFVGGALPRLMQSMASSGAGGGNGSGGPGNALMSAFAKIVQGQMPKTAAEEFAKMGLGTATQIEGSSQSQTEIKGKDLFLRNPYEWVQQVLMPALAAKGVTSEQDVIATIAKMMPVRTASQVITEMALQGRYHEGENSPFEKDIGLQKGAMALAPSFAELSRRDYPTILREFDQQWTNLLQTLGGPLMAPNGPVIAALSGVTGAMAGLNHALAGVQPETITTAMKAIGALAVGLVALVAVPIAGFIASLITLPGLLIAGAAGLAVFVAAEWSTVVSDFEKVGKAISSLAAVSWHGVVEMFDGIKNAIASFLSTITGLYDKVKGLFGGVSAPKTKADQDFLNGINHAAPMRFMPSIDRNVTIHNAMALNIDGQTLAQAISDQLERMYGYPTGAPTPDGSGRYFAGDHNYADI